MTKELTNPSGTPLSAFRDEHDIFISYAWPGGYPVIYLDEENNLICPNCANEPLRVVPVIMGDVYYEGPTLYCDDCEAPIKSAYGDPDNPDTNEDEEEEQEGEP